MATQREASRERMAAEMREHGMELQHRHGSPGSDGPGDRQWQMVLAQMDQAQMNNPRMS